MFNFALVVCIHGDEQIGMRIARKFKNFKTIIGNPLATKKRRRFIDSDLNRVFPGKQNGNYEERRAFELKKILDDCDCVIDLHSSSSSTPPFVILTKRTKKHLSLARATGIERIVFMSNELAGGKSLIDSHRCAIAVELGKHNTEIAYKHGMKAIRNIINYLKTKKHPNVEREFFKVIGVLKKPCDEFNVKLKNFRKIAKGELIGKCKNAKLISASNFYPMLANEKAYVDIICLIGKKVSYDR